MKKLLILTLVSVVTFFAHAQSSDTTDRIDAIFKHWNNATPGGSILVSKGDRIIYHKAFGLADLEHNVPNTTETVFEAGSVSKQFTAASILLLATEGKLSPQDDVRKYIPELPVYDAPILIQHLLNHTSGLKDWGVIGSLTGWPRTTRVYTQELALEIICKQRSLNFTPGTEYSYSNSNYSLLVTIVERVSKQTLADFTRIRFFEPLGMKNTKWRNNFREIVPNRAIAYNKTKTGYEQMMPFEHIHGHGGLLTTTGDLLKWNTLLETHAIGGNKLYNLRIQQGLLKNGKQIRYAGGLNIETFFEQREISHSGATAGYRAWLAYYPQTKLTIAILSNDGFSSVPFYGEQVARILLKEPKHGPFQFKYITIPDKDFEKFQGVYRNTRGPEVFTISDFVSNGLTDHIVAPHPDTILYKSSRVVYIDKNRISRVFDGDTATYKRVSISDTTLKFIQPLVGIYSSSEADATFEVLLKNNELWVSRKPSTLLKLKPAYRDAFYVDGFELLEFKRDKKGKVISFEISLSRAERIPFTRVSKDK